ncbi:MAG: sensor histidine kinase [Spirochaetales bacterium]|nr:sensor histidine kinase [Spirochaetales bacterium]
MNKIVQESCLYEDTASTSYVLQLKTFKKVYGFAVLLIENPDTFYRFETVMNNFINIVAMHLENLDNRHTLEERVRKRTEELEQSVKEKDFLMGELNHRVKNNLMMINALIRLKNDTLSDEIDLSDISQQIETISIVHEKLYKTAAITCINFRDYVEDILSSVFSFAGREVQIEKTIDVKEMSTKTTIPLGLIINEVATNAMKYGFKPDEQAVFSIRLRKENEYYVLVLSNNGNQFPEDVDFESSETLGLRLIKTLAGQLDGTVELQKKPTPVFTIRFPGEEE